MREEVKINNRAIVIVEFDVTNGIPEHIIENTNLNM
jgi:hypothetical protein